MILFTGEINTIAKINFAQTRTSFAKQVLREQGVGAQMKCITYLLINDLKYPNYTAFQRNFVWRLHQRNVQLENKSSMLPKIFVIM